MAASPIFIGSVRRATGTVSAANTNRDGTGTIVTLFTAGSSGSAIFRIRMKATGTTTAGMIRLFGHDGTSVRLDREFAVSAVTPSGTVPTWEAELFLNGNEMMVLPSGHSLRASTHNAETFVITVEGGDY